MTALRKLLVVDDDPVVGASFNRVLSGKGYIVVAAENGAEALERLKGEKFDAVFTDLRMPGMDGLQVAERVRAAQPWTPVVIVTGYGSAATEARARAVGVSDFINKPLSPEMIEESAEKALRTVSEGAPAPALQAPAPAPAVVVVAPPAEPTEAQRPGGVLRMLKNMALFLAAPFIGLVYAVLLPFVGLGMLLWVATEGMRKPKQAKPAAHAPTLVVVPKAAEPARTQPAESAVVTAAKLVFGVLAAPFIGLAYIVVMPFAGLGALAWFGLKAAFARAE